MNIINLGPPPTLTPLSVGSDGKVRLNEEFLGRWLNQLWVALTQMGALLEVTVTLDFPNTLPQTSSALTVSVPGALIGMPVQLAAPEAASGCTFRADVTAADVVTVYFVNASAIAVNPASAVFTVIVQQ